MRPAILMLSLVAAVFAAGCARIDTPSRNQGFESTLSSGAGYALDAPAFAASLPSFRVEAINVVVPDGLIISEANVYYPRGDIVWHGDPPGDRAEQIAALFDEAFTYGTATMQGEVPVALDVTLERFHALTPKTRYTFGGVHAIRFTLAVRDAETGLLLQEPRSIKANLKAFGGQRAIDAERQGQTQKVRITNHLAEVIREEL